ncbi:MAG: arylamine N-acetyltransferase [Oscillochloris sp.]|nr:arylamine N-acetyltransferase [Oscillochloris sp.]
MQLESYLERIGYTGPVRPDFKTLCAIHRAHLLTITYENLDIHLGRQLTLDLPQIFAKLVDGRRGGWCYEMNVLLAWVLRQIGFQVSFLSGTVDRAGQRDVVEGNHLLLLVELDQPYLADAGFGNGFLDPLPLVAGNHRQGFLTYQLSTDGMRWYFENHVHGGPGFDMLLTPRRLEDFSDPAHILQTSPASGFVRTTVCHRFTPVGIITLRGAVLTEVRAEGVEQRTIGNAAEYVAVLEEQFDLHIPQAATLWEPIWQRHVAWHNT